MLLPPVRRQGKLIRRYKRFLADVCLNSGETLTVHCPNSGSMRGCSEPGSPVVISRSDNPKRKYPWTLEMVRAGDTWVGVNTSLTNRIVREGLEEGIIDIFGTIHSIRPEPVVAPGSRLDFFLESEAGEVYLEVKNCSLAQEGVALFPDAVTSRGTRHLRELDRLREQGFTTALLFCVQRSDADCFAPAVTIDPLYARTLNNVRQRGVLVLAWQAEVRPESVRLRQRLPLCQGVSHG